METGDLFPCLARRGSSRSLGQANGAYSRSRAEGRKTARGLRGEETHAPAGRPTTAAVQDAGRTRQQSPQSTPFYTNRRVRARAQRTLRKRAARDTVRFSRGFPSPTPLKLPSLVPRLLCYPAASCGLCCPVYERRKQFSITFPLCDSSLERVLLGFIASHEPPVCFSSLLSSFSTHTHSDMLRRPLSQAERFSSLADLCILIDSTSLSTPLHAIAQWRPTRARCLACSYGSFVTHTKLHLLISSFRSLCTLYTAPPQLCARALSRAAARRR